jgi:enoyl-CoA hydratase/carnithine racemase
MHSNKINFIDDKFLNELNEAMDTLEKDPLRCVIFTSTAIFFSAGLNLPYVLSLDQQGMDKFLALFGKTMFRLATAPYPTFSAIHGHAIAGGTVFALSTDERIAVDGPYKCGLIEVAIGMCFPGYIGLVVKNALQKGNFYGDVLRGTTFTPAEAVRVGMFDFVVDSQEKLLPFTIERASAIKKHSLAPYREAKRFLQLPITQMAATPGFIEDLDKRFRNIWFSPSSQAFLKERAAQIKKQK